jgi:hypothetical protein
MAASAIGFDVALRITPAFRLHALISSADLLDQLNAATQHTAKIAAETRALLARIAELEGAAASGGSTTHAIAAVTTQAERVRALTAPMTPQESTGNV